MPEGAADDEEVPNGVVVGEFFPGVEEDAYGVGEPAEEDAEGGGGGHLGEHAGEGEGAGPAHDEVEGHGEPFPAAEEEELVEEPGGCHAPNEGEVGAAGQVAQQQGGVGAGDEEVDADVVELAQAVFPLGALYGVVGGGGGVDEGHAAAENEQSGIAGAGGGQLQQVGQPGKCEQQPKGVGEGVGALLGCRGGDEHGFCRENAAGGGWVVVYKINNGTF